MSKVNTISKREKDFSNSELVPTNCWMDLMCVNTCTFNESLALSDVPDDWRQPKVSSL